MLMATFIQALVEAPTLMAIRATESVFAWSLALQTLEYLRMGKYTADDAFWSWPLQRADVPNAPVRAVLDVLFQPRLHQLHLVLRLCAAVALAVQQQTPPQLADILNRLKTLESAVTNLSNAVTTINNRLDGVSGTGTVTCNPDGSFTVSITINI